MKKSQKIKKQLDHNARQWVDLHIQASNLWNEELLDSNRKLKDFNETEDQWDKVLDLAADMSDLNDKMKKLHKQYREQLKLEEE